jgi:hypothetical protein
VSKNAVQKCMLHIPKVSRNRVFREQSVFFRKTSPRACNSQNNALYCLNFSSLSKTIGSIYFAVQGSLGGDFTCVCVCVCFFFGHKATCVNCTCFFCCFDNLMQDFFQNLLCCTDLKKCCPKMYVAYTQSVEEQSILGIKLLCFYRNIPPSMQFSK